MRKLHFQIPTVRKRRRMLRMTMTKMMKGMKWKRQERKMTDLTTWGSERQCRDMKRHLLVLADYIYQSFVCIYFLTVLGTLCIYLRISEVCGVATICFVFSFSEPVNRKQSNPSLFDTHRSPARRSHIRLVEICQLQSNLMLNVLWCVTLKEPFHYHD